MSQNLIEPKFQPHAKTKSDVYKLLINVDICQALGIADAREALDHVGKVLDHLHRHGTRKTPSFENPITRYLMSGRWRYFFWASRVQETELKWWAKDFIRAYKAQVASVKGGYYLPAGSSSL